MTDKTETEVHDWAKWLPPREIPDSGPKVFMAGQVIAWRISGLGEVVRLVSPSKGNVLASTHPGGLLSDVTNAWSLGWKCAVLVADVDCEPTPPDALYVSRSPEVTQGRPEGPFQVGETVFVQVNQPCCASLVRGQEVRVERIANNADGDIYVRDCNGDTWLVGAEQLARPSSSTPAEGAQPVGSGEARDKFAPGNVWQYRECIEDGIHPHARRFEVLAWTGREGMTTRIRLDNGRERSMGPYLGNVATHVSYPATPAVQPVPGPTKAKPRTRETYATLLAKLEAEEGVKPLPTCGQCGARAVVNQMRECAACYARADKSTQRSTAAKQYAFKPYVAELPPWVPSCDDLHDIPSATEFGTSLPGEARGTRR